MLRSILTQAHQRRNFAKEAGWIVAGQILATLGALFTIRVLTAVLPPAAYGQLSLSLIAASIGQVLLMGPLSNAAVRYYRNALDENRGGIFLRALGYYVRAAVGLLSAAGSVAALAALALGVRELAGLALLVTLLSVVLGLTSVVDGLQLSARNRTVVALHYGAGYWVKNLLLCAVAALYPARVAAALGAYLAGAVLVLCSQWYFYMKSHPVAPLQAEEDRLWRAKVWDYAWPFTTWGAVIWISSNCDRWALQWWRSGSDVGIYQVLYQLAYYPMTVATGLAVQFVTPIMFGQAGDGADLARVARAQRSAGILLCWSLAATGIAVLAAWTFHRKLFEWLVGPAYWGASPLLPLVIAAAGFHCASQIVTMLPLAEGRTNTLIVPKITAGLIALALTFYGAAAFGVTGVALAGLASNVIFTAWIVTRTQLPSLLRAPA